MSVLMATHRALLHADVLSHLFMTMVDDVEEADVDFGQRLEMEVDLRSTLLRCSLVCRTFCDPALSALWWRLDNLVPLLRLLSCFVPTKVKRKGPVRQGGGPNDDTLYLLKGELSPKDWARFSQYARRVRVLNFPKIASVTPHIVSQLSKWNNGAPLLPGLKELTWLPASPTDTAALLVGTDKLELLHIVLDCITLPDDLEWIPRNEKMAALRDPSTRSLGDKHVEKMLGMYAERVPHLQTLELITSVHPLCLAPVARFTRLTSFHCRDTPVDAQFVRTIASSLKALESLVINFLLNAQELDTPIVGLRHLSSLEVTSPSAHLTRLFNMLNPLEELRSLTIFYPNGIPELSETYRRPLEALRARGHAPALASCVLDITTRWNTRETLAQLVEPLLSIPTLEHIAVRAPRSGYQVTERDLERMARAWPKVHSLALMWNARAGGATPPVRALAHFAQHCPRLRSFILSHIDCAAPLPPPPYKMGTHGLLHLFTMESYRIADPKAVGRYISAMFPKILVAVPDPQPSGWDDVLHMAAAWRAARAKRMAEIQAEKAAK
ncbi:uncharacterized protein TRAVEDRAFT_74247 [Trametes versicolor FP-101664 SS1]|uniref:uncharacterized protein n=1 Tax=Trametes versicolor (strain FP-101664) TaxID=717944 RepID=UPI0004621D41|nr:uncharacterized protein TRAVEDRAFT_74247 [Trametes versicolor FP-101664 SS1]EIW53869.1 hypothetical protein TRAVEDRAFT_74247 [Trametes versicolor FP-101664 SS1]